MPVLLLAALVRRFVVSVPAQADQAKIERLIRAAARPAAATPGVVVDRVIIVPGRIISLVVRPKLARAVPGSRARPS
ncbi:MAG TPA: hypothetical protein VFI65_20420 [Streptosporangiaceae bacterium]|nr:hypothetical protein [Streptosporangiaceae bacterium]